MLGTLCNNRWSRGTQLCSIKRYHPYIRRFRAYFEQPFLHTSYWRNVHVKDKSFTIIVNHPFLWFVTCVSAELFQPNPYSRCILQIFELVSKEAVSVDLLRPLWRERVPRGSSTTKPITYSVENIHSPTYIERLAAWCPILRQLNEKYHKYLCCRVYTWGGFWRARARAKQPSG
jgi:hypothetical protein